MKEQTELLVKKINNQEIAFYCTNRTDYLKFRKALSYCGIEIPDRKEDDAVYFKNYPYFVIGCNRGIYTAPSFERICYDWENINNACNIDNVVTATDMIYENEVSDLQKFVDGRLIVEVNNVNDYILFMNQLKAAGFNIPEISSVDADKYSENYPYYFTWLSIRHEKSVIMEKASNKEYIKKDYGIVKYTSFRDMDSVKEYFSIKPVNDKPEPDYKLLYEQVKAERDIAFGQLEALGTSFGEKEDAAKERMEGNVLHHLDSLLDRKKEEIIFRLNNTHGSKNQWSVLMDEIKKASNETAKWLKQERKLKDNASIFENANAMFVTVKRGTALYNLDNGDYVWLYNRYGNVAIDNINVLTANELAKKAVDSSEYWEDFLPMGAKIHTKEEFNAYCENNYHSTWITTEEYENVLGLFRS